jgi:hypothetical protein
VFRRDPRHLQVGCAPGVILPDRPGLFALLRRLDGVRDLTALRRIAKHAFPELEVGIEEALRPLIAAGLVVDVDVPPRTMPTVGLRYDPPATALAGTLADSFSQLGAGVGPDADVTVVLSTGEPRRGTLAGMVRSGRAHLCVVLDGARVRIGPWVLPGHTPCLECLDLHRSAWDPAWLALVPQFGHPPPDTAVTAAVRLAAAAVVVEEVDRFADGARPKTCSSVFQVGPGLDVRVVAESAFHPRCGCAVFLAA